VNAPFFFAFDPICKNSAIKYTCIQPAYSISVTCFSYKHFVRSFTVPSSSLPSNWQPIANTHPLVYWLKAVLFGVVDDFLCTFIEVCLNVTYLTWRYHTPYSFNIFFSRFLYRLFLLFVHNDSGFLIKSDINLPSLKPFTDRKSVV